MRYRRRARADEGYTNPAAESIDEALARLARQDKRLNPVSPPRSRGRAAGRPRVTRDRIWTVVRWTIILVAAVLIWRFLGSGTG